MILSKLVCEIKARQILASRGSPTVEIDFVSANGLVRASVPAGASTGGHEAAVFLDNGLFYGGCGVSQVVKKINELSTNILLLSANSQEDFDQELSQLDGMSKYANFTLALSLCFTKLLAKNNKISLFTHISKEACATPGSNTNNPMPYPYFNVINGGMHAGGGLWCQETMVRFDCATMSENLEHACCFYAGLKEAISKQYGMASTGVGDEGGFAPPIQTIELALALLQSASAISGIEDYKIAFDFAANSFYDGERYKITTEDGPQTLTGKELADFYAQLIEAHPRIVSIEDPFAEDDHASWENLYRRLGDKIDIVADDLTVTNPGMIKKYLAKGMFNTVLIKPNQIGYVHATYEAMRACRMGGCKIFVSHRSSETEDTFIADLAVGGSAEYVKFGAPCRGERVAKYNRLLRIEEEITNNK